MKTTLAILTATILSACSLTPQQIDQGANFGLRIIEAKGKLSAEDAKLIQEGKAILLQTPTGK